MKLTKTQLRKACDTLYGKGGQTRMAECLGVDGSTVRRWIHGSKPIPGPVRVAVNLMLERHNELEAKRPLPPSK